MYSIKCENMCVLYFSTNNNKIIGSKNNSKSNTQQKVNKISTK